MAEVRLNPPEIKRRVLISLRERRKLRRESKNGLHIVVEMPVVALVSDVDICYLPCRQAVSRLFYNVSSGENNQLYRRECVLRCLRELKYWPCHLTFGGDERLMDVFLPTIVGLALQNFLKRSFFLRRNKNTVE